MPEKDDQKRAAAAVVYTAMVHTVGYVAAVPCNEQIPTTRMGTRCIDTLAVQAPDEAWTRISAGRGTKSPRLYD